MCIPHDYEIEDMLKAEQEAEEALTAELNKSIQRGLVMGNIIDAVVEGSKKDRIKETP
jgi:hypothetical protein